MAFIAREQDLAFFERCYGKRKAQLVVLYGRRRVGKTSCLGVKGSLVRIQSTRPRNSRSEA